VTPEELDPLLEFPEAAPTEDQEEPSCEVVRLRVSEYKSQRGYAVRIELNRVERHCTGYQPLKEDFSNGGELISRITNLLDVKPGLYEVRATNFSKDWETGYVDDWDLVLVPFKPAPPAAGKGEGGGK
jgi:hypothetical protein